MVNGYANLPQKIVDIIPTIQDEGNGLYATEFEDEVICEELHRIASLGKPIMISAKMPFGVELVSPLSLFRTLSSDEYTELFALKMPDVFTFEIQARKTKVSGPLEEPDYAKKVRIAISVLG